MLFPDGKREERIVPVENSSRPKETVAKALNDFMHAFHIEGEGSQHYGIFGYTAANAVRYFENIPVKDTTMERNDAPDMLYLLFKDIIVFDHFNNMMDYITLGSEDDLRLLQTAAARTNVKAFGFRAVGETTSTLTDEEHKANVRRCVKHCLRGDVFQIVISRRFVQKYEGDDFKLYRALRAINPSPYLFYFDFGGFRIFGSSPETHNRIVCNSAFIDPIAGTTKRTGDVEQDRKNAEFLRNDPKENAEHVMLVDLARNDAPDMLYILYKDIIVFDHFNNMMDFVTLGSDDDLQLLLTAANRSNVKPYDFRAIGEATSTLTDEEHKANVRRCVKHCLRGDVFQIVISRRFVQKYEGDDFKLYRALHLHQTLLLLMPLPYQGFLF